MKLTRTLPNGLCTKLILLSLLLFGWCQPAESQQDWQVAYESLRQTVAQQHQVIEQQGAILQAQQEQLESLRQQSLSASATSAVVAGYDKGFFISSGGDSAKFLLNIGSWGQLRHNLFESDNLNPDENDLDLERLRLVFSGHAFNPRFTYFFQIDADSDAFEDADMLDYYVTYDVGSELFCCKEGTLAVRCGKWKMGFNRAREESGAKMQFSDRSTASVLFDFDRGLGFGLLGAIGSVDWQVAVANGIDTGGFRGFRTVEFDRNPAITTRVNWLLTGDWGSDGHADLDWREHPAIRLGSGFTCTRPDIEGLREFAFPRVVDSGRSIALVLPSTITAYNLYMYATDLNIKYRGFSLVYEHYFRNFSGFSGGSVPDLFDHGYWAEIGYFVVPERLQLLARHAHIVGNSGTLGAEHQSSDEVAGGIVLYLRGQNAKLTFDATHLNGAPVNDSALNIRPGDSGWLFRTQFQWKF